MNKYLSVTIKQLEDRLNILVSKNHEQTSNYTKGIISGECNFIKYLLGQEKSYFTSLPKLEIQKLFK